TTARSAAPARDPASTTYVDGSPEVGPSQLRTTVAHVTKGRSYTATRGSATGAGVGDGDAAGASPLGGAGAPGGGDDGGGGDGGGGGGCASAACNTTIA